MKRSFYILTGVLIAAILVIFSAWFIGAIFGPLYQSEDESTRNFNVFLAILLSASLAGGLFANRHYRNRLKDYESH